MVIGPGHRGVPQLRTTGLSDRQIVMVMSSSAVALQRHRSRLSVGRSRKDGATVKQKSSLQFYSSGDWSDCRNIPVGFVLVCVGCRSVGSAVCV